MTEAASKCATILHLAAFAAYSYIVYFTFYHFSLPIPNPSHAYAGRWKYLTVWNICLCGFYFGLCVVLNFLPFKSLRRFRDYIFCSISLPSCIFVTGSFWGLYAYDPELILPARIQAHYPSWLNHGSHTLILVTAMLEALLSRHQVPSKAGGFLGMLSWFAVYQAWVLWLGNVKGVWVYPVLQVLSAGQLTVYFITNSLLSFLMYLGCHALLRCKNRESVDDGDSELKKVL